MKKLLAFGMICALSLGTLGITASTASAHGLGHHRSSISIHKDGFSLHIREDRRHHRHRDEYRPAPRHIRHGHHRHPHHW